MTTPRERAEFNRLADLGATEFCGGNWRPPRTVETVHLTGDHLMIQPYRILVTGSRDWTEADIIHDALDRVSADPIGRGQPTIIVHGACPTGADAIADAWAVKQSQRSGLITYERHPATGHPTQNFGVWPGCGPTRNRYMVNELGADACTAFIGPCTKTNCRLPGPHASHGASGCADLAEQAGIDVYRWFLS